MSIAGDKLEEALKRALRSRLKDDREVVINLLKQKWDGDMNSIQLIAYRFIDGQDVIQISDDDDDDDDPAPSAKRAHSE